MPNRRTQMWFMRESTCICRCLTGCGVWLSKKKYLSCAVVHIRFVRQEENDPTESLALLRVYKRTWNWTYVEEAKCKSIWRLKCKWFDCSVSFSYSFMIVLFFYYIESYELIWKFTWKCFAMKFPFSWPY